MYDLWDPLSKLEEELLYQGIKKHGGNFKLISKNYLPLFACSDSEKDMADCR